jgi:hypothetical protein
MESSIQVCVCLPISIKLFGNGGSNNILFAHNLGGMDKTAMSPSKTSFVTICKEFSWNLISVTV